MTSQTWFAVLCASWRRGHVVVELVRLPHEDLAVGLPAAGNAFTLLAARADDLERDYSLLVDKVVVRGSLELDAALAQAAGLAEAAAIVARQSR